MKITVRPLTPELWPDFEAVFNAKGCSVARGCWCMFYRESGRAIPATGTRIDCPREVASMIWSERLPVRNSMPAWKNMFTGHVTGLIVSV